MGRVNLLSIFKSHKVKRFIVFLFTIIIVYSISVTTISTKKYDLKEGDIAKVDIKAPREIKDELLTEGSIQQAVDAVPPEIVKRQEVKYDSIHNLTAFFSKIEECKEAILDDPGKLTKLKKESPVLLPDEDFKALLVISSSELKDLQSMVIQTMNEVYDSNNILEENGQGVKDALESKKKAQELIDLKFKSSKLSKGSREVGINICDVELRPNAFFDKEATEEKKKEAMKKVAPIMIKKDQIIVKDGEPVTKHQIEILKDLGYIDNDRKSQWVVYLSLGGFVILLLSIQWYYLYKYHREYFDDIGKLVLISLVTGIMLILSRAIMIISPFLVPFTWAPMLLTLLLNDKVSFGINMLNCILISGIIGFRVEITLIAVLSVILGTIALKKMQQRNDILYASIRIGIIGMLLTFCIGFLLSNNALDVSKRAICTLIAGVISGIFTLGFLPFFESAFDIVTTVKLLELSNPNHPLLKRLLLETPGTYHHSVLVGNLAEVAAEEVGGNPVLTRVAAYYHDVGKIKRPYFFKENQLGGENPHHKITPNLSALIIISHVKDGLELAKEYKLPKVIQEAIEQHHGTSLVKYFYVTAKNNSEKPEEVDEASFKYPGPVPQNKEFGIIMLADSVEAAVRSLSEPSKDKIEEMVGNIIKARLNDSQLDQCDLTLRDLDKIKKAFIKTLYGIYHHRIEYPEEKKE